MFIPSRSSQSQLGKALGMVEVLYHATVRNVRQGHANAIMALVKNMLQAIIFVLAFYILMTVLGLRTLAIRGDFLLYIMSGIFLFLTHTKTLGAVVGSEGPASAMMKHAPMNTMVSIMSAALSALYIQVLSMFTILYVYHLAFKPVTILDPISAFAMLMIAWFTGLAIGLVLLAIKPWFPTGVTIFSQVYQRANMIASGKMFVANQLPGWMLAFFDWNPLFHAIDQARGYAFINYFPRHSSWEYAIWVGIIFTMIGLMGEFYTRKHASASWGARR